MASGFPGGYPELFNGGNGRSIMFNNGGNSIINNNSNIGINGQGVYRSPLAGILSDSSSQTGFRRPDLIGKWSLAEFQQQQQFQHAIYLRNVKPRPYQEQTSPISPLSPMDFSASSISSSYVSSISNNSSAVSGMSVGVPNLHIQTLNWSKSRLNPNPKRSKNQEEESQWNNRVLKYAILGF